MKTIRIFISSPGDVAEERERARQVVEQLRRRYAGQFDLKAVLWEDLPLQPDMSFQQGIDLVLTNERGVDIAVFILWSRLGTPTGALVQNPRHGGPYRSGTDREFDLMRQARTDARERVERGELDKIRPDILVYTRNDEASFDERLRGQPTEEKDKLLSQKKLVETFIKEEFHDASSGTNVRAFHAFDQPVTFSQRLRTHLQELLDGFADGMVGDPIWDTAVLGSPFRGLEAFDFAHSPVFFGREDEVLEVRRALQRKALEGCAFVLVSGASGSGKSSLARAGVIPAVTEYEVDATVCGWRHAACTPAQFEGNLCGGLARLLCSPEVLPELRLADDSVDVLSEGLATAPKATVDQSLRPALVRASCGKTGTTRLLLLVDQLEELFTDKRLSDVERDRFMAALQALARSGAVWVFATVRSDFYRQCQRLPALMRLKEGPGQIDLLPAAADALRRLIEQPARLAGISFEVRDGKSLADRILIDAAAHAELLPLVSYVLRELFERRTPAGALTFDAYESLGGVEGALATRAESVFTSLPTAAQNELSVVLRALVSVSGDDEESVVRQHAALSLFEPESPARVLVDRFIAERFLVTGKGADGGGTVAVAHEALLRAWSRAAQWIADNREFLRIRSRVAARMKEGGRLLDGDPLLDAARHQLAALPDGFTPEQRAFIEDAIAEVERRRRRARRIRNTVMAGLSALTLAALAAMGWAITERNKTQEANRLNQENLRAASNADLASALKAWQEDFDAQQKGEWVVGVNGKSRWHEAVALLARSLERNPNNKRAAYCLYNTILNQGHARRDWPTFVLPHLNRVKSASFSPDGSRIVTASDDNTARVWDASTGKSIGERLWHVDVISSANFSSDGGCVVTVSDDNTARVWDVSTGKPIGAPLQHANWVKSGSFSPDGSRVVTASDDKMAQVWDAGTGKPIGLPLRHNAEVNSVSFSPDGSRVVTVSYDNTARVWDANTGNPISVPLRHESTVLSAIFSPDGARVVTASWDHTARVWDVSTGKPLGEPLSHYSVVNRAIFSPDGSRVVTASGVEARVWDASTGKPVGEPLRHEYFVISAIFSPTGSNVVTVCSDSNPARVRVWDANTGKPMGEPLQHKNTVRSVSFSPDGYRAVTAGDDNTARVWDVSTGKPIGESLRHGAAVCSAIFSPDGSRVVTASEDNTARVWDVSTVKQIGKPIRRKNDIRSPIINPDSSRVAMAGDDNSTKMWDAHWSARFIRPDFALAIDPSVIAWAYAFAGLRYTADGELHEIPFDEQRVSLIDGKESLPPEWKLLANWVLDRSPSRLLHPSSKFTVRQIAERERDFKSVGTVESLTSSLGYDYTLPLTRLLIANALEKDNAAKYPDVRDDTIPPYVAHLRRYDLDRLPDDAVLWARAAKALNDAPEGAMVGIGAKAIAPAAAAMEAPEKALKLKPNNPDALRERDRARATLRENINAQTLITKQLPEAEKNL